MEQENKEKYLRDDTKSKAVRKYLAHFNEKKSRQSTVAMATGAFSFLYAQNIFP